MRITTEFLKSKAACASGIALFKRLFPDGADITEEACLKAHDAGFREWRWLAHALDKGSEYDKAIASAQAEYDKAIASARAEYGKATAPAQAEYDKAIASARAEYDKAIASARAEYNKAHALAFASLFK